MKLLWPDHSKPKPSEEYKAEVRRFWIAFAVFFFVVGPMFYLLDKPKNLWWWLICLIFGTLLYGGWPYPSKYQETSRSDRRKPSQ
jgi:RsiW-degrading membrane proteinase PrsW (M82 family)